MQTSGQVMTSHADLRSGHDVTLSRDVILYNFAIAQIGTRSTLLQINDGAAADRHPRRRVTVVDQFGCVAGFQSSAPALHGAANGTILLQNQCFGSGFFK